MKFKILSLVALFCITTQAFATYVAPPYTVPKGGTGDVTFTSNHPLIGNGTSAIAQGTVSGNTTEFATATGTLTSGHCVSIDASGNFVDAGAACSTSVGTVTSVAFSDASGSPIFSISGSPVTSSGTLTETLVTQNANIVFAGPSSGGAAQPTFRALVNADLPFLSVVNGGNTAYSILATDGHVRSGTALTAGRAYTLDLCTSNIGERHEIKNLPSQTFNITVTGNTSDTIDGASTYVLAPGDSVSVICAASGAWDIE